MFFFFTNRLGCLGSIVISIALSALLMLADEGLQLRNELLIGD